jgi:hypothetical protein
MLEVATVIEGPILFHSGIQVTEGFIPLNFNVICKHGSCERGVATLCLEILRP